MSETLLHLFEDFDKSKVRRLDTVARIKSGRRPPKGANWLDAASPHPFIRSTDIGEGKVDLSNLVFLSEEDWNLMSTKGVETGDVLVSIAGSIGKIGIVPSQLSGAAVTENIARITVTASIISPEYLAQFLLSPQTQTLLRMSASSTVIPKLSLRTLSELQVPVVQIDEQEKIVATIRNTTIQIDTLRSRLKTDVLAASMSDSIRNQSFTELRES